MKKVRMIVLSLLLLTFSLSFADIPVMNFDEFERYLHKETDTTYVINFWATWCKPCVEEIPYFEKLNSEYSDRPVKVLMVSLDFARNLQSRLIPFIADNNMKSEVILLNDTRSHIWIEKVDPSWTGAIPATVIYNSKKRSFYEQAFKYHELESELLRHLNVN
jgi:thiol-disulfide isomerase/thioredoxin